MKKLIRELLPLVIMCAMMLYTLAVIIFTEVSMQYQHYMALMLITVCWATFYISRNAFRYMMLLTLVLGLMNVMYFTPYMSSAAFRISIGSGAENQPRLWKGIQPESFLLLFVYVFVGDISMLRRITNLVRRPEPSPEEAEQETQHKVQFWKKKFASKSEEELNNIINQPDRFLPEAREAAKELVNEELRMKNEGGPV
ncbi:MAG: hypothetical protein KDD36_13315 [Flavobacteriales bacterium]|nr:hypothetical protein [Flavobacteriales bacterium]